MQDADLIISRKFLSDPSSHGRSPRRASARTRSVVARLNVLGWVTLWRCVWMQHVTATQHHDWRNRPAYLELEDRYAMKNYQMHQDDTMMPDRAGHRHWYIR